MKVAADKANTIKLSQSLATNDAFTIYFDFGRAGHFSRFLLKAAGFSVGHNFPPFVERIPLRTSPLTCDNARACIEFPSYKRIIWSLLYCNTYHLGVPHTQERSV